MGPCPTATSSRGAGAFARQARGRHSLSPGRVALPATDAQAGFALLEVLISAVILALIVTATFTGFDVANRATASERAHAQADVLAQQDEDRLRSLQINELSGLNATRTVTYNGTVYTINSTGEFLADSTESPSCVKEAGSASYVRTTSKVTWPALGSRSPVVETGLITPPIGGELLVQVFDGTGKGVSGMIVEATGPTPSGALVSGTTGANGCVIFSAMKEGEYSVTTHQAGYVDKDGNSEPPASQRVASVTTGSTTKKQFQFAKAGALTVNFVTTGTATPEGDQFLIYNNGMTTPFTRTFGTLGTYFASITTAMTLFPFGEPGPPAISPYTVWAGTCASNKPSANGQPESSNPAVNVLPGLTVPVNVPVPAVNFQVFGGKTGEEGEKVGAFTGTLTDEGCENKVRSFSASVALNGEFHKAMPYGSKYSLCVASKAKVGSPLEYRRLRGTSVANNLATGTALVKIFLSSGEKQSSSALTCP
jgi:Tfp pilus assembly protein PilV